MTDDVSYPCPCCGHLVFGEPPGSHDICPVCFREDDLAQLRFVRTTGANHVPLIEAQQYAIFGARERRFTTHVRQPRADEPIDNGWRPADPTIDQIDDPISGVNDNNSYPDDKLLCSIGVQRIDGNARANRA